MKIEKNSIITLEDDSKYLVVKIVKSNGQTFAYVINVNDKDDDGFVMIDGDNLIVITDVELIKTLATFI